MEVFYIGIGRSKYRFKEFKSRNKHWNNIVNKEKEFTYQILMENLSKEDSCEIEIMLINMYGLNNLCNITNGGETGISFHTEESRIKMKESHKGVKLLKHHVEAIQNSRKYGKDHFASRKVIENSTGKIFESIKLAAEYKGMKIRTLHAQLHEENKNISGLTLLNK